MERSVALFAVLFTYARAEFPTKEFVEQLRPVVEKCEEETGVDKTLVEEFSRGENMADDQKLKCYMKCIFVDLDLLNESNGIFRYDKMVKMVPEEMKTIAWDMGHMCVHFKGEEGSDLCQVSYDLHKCWQKKDPKDNQESEPIKTENTCDIIDNSNENSDNVNNVQNSENLSTQPFTLTSISAKTTAPSAKLSTEMSGHLSTPVTTSLKKSSLM